MKEMYESYYEENELANKNLREEISKNNKLNDINKKINKKTITDYEKLLKKREQTIKELETKNESLEEEKNFSEDFLLFKLGIFNNES